MTLIPTSVRLRVGLLALLRSSGPNPSSPGSQRKETSADALYVSLAIVSVLAPADGHRRAIVVGGH